MSAWWELAGIPLSDAPPSYRSGLPAPMLRLVERVAQRGVLIPKTDALDEVLDSTGPQSLREQKLVVWGDAGGACYVAAHESMIPVKDLFRIAREIRTAAGDATRIWRVGARPFGGSAGAWHWVDGWRDSCVPPPTKSLFDHLLDAEQLVTSFGKCGDFFNGSGFTRSIPVERTATAWSDLLKTLTTTPRGLIVTGLFDDLARVPRKEFVPILAEQLRQFDARLPELQRMLKSEDCVCLIADHARDPQSPQLATREYAPLLVFGPNLARGVNLGDRASLADLGQTIAEAFQAARLSVGESFLAALRPG